MESAPKPHINLTSSLPPVKGVCDLVAMPIEQYKRDGRIFRGLRRGANSFVTCTAMSALDLTNRMVQCVQVTYVYVRYRVR